jgi:hypothetical protein
MKSGRSSGSKKYAPTTQPDQLIRFNEQRQGSNIWNTAWRNRPLIQQHAFWEIRNGESAIFWQDSWQQLPPLDEMESLHPLKLKLQQYGLKRLRILAPKSRKTAMETMENQQNRSTDYGGLSTFYRGRNACNSGRFLLRKAWTFSDGVTPPQVFSRSKKLTTFK